MDYLKIKNGIVVVEENGGPAIIKLGHHVDLRIDQSGPVPALMLFASEYESGAVHEQQFKVIDCDGPFIEIAGMRMQIILAFDPDVEHGTYGFPVEIVGVESEPYSTYHTLYLAGRELNSVLADAVVPPIEDDEETLALAA